MPTLGKYIRQRRMELGLTQEELAERVGTGVRQSEISRLENDHVSLPRRARLELIAAALEVSIGTLLARSGWAGAEEIEPDTAEPDLVPLELATLEPIADGHVGNGQADNLVISNGEHDHQADTALVTLPRLQRLERIAQALEVPIVALQPQAEGLEDTPPQAVPGPNGHADSGPSAGPSADDASPADLAIPAEELVEAVRELRTIREDLQLHSLELQMIALAGETARHQLQAAFDGVEDGVVVIDGSGQVVLQNATYSDIAESGGASVPMLDEHGQPLDAAGHPFSRAARGDEFTMNLGLDRPEGPAWYVVHARQVATEYGGRLGVVTFQDCPDED